MTVPIGRCKERVGLGCTYIYPNNHSFISLKDKDMFVKYLFPIIGSNVQKLLWHWKTDSLSHRNHLHIMCIRSSSLKAMGLRIY